MPPQAQDRPAVRPWLCAALVLAAAVVASAPEATDARNPAPGTSATRLLGVDLSRGELGLSSRAPAGRLARAALARHAGRLGLSRLRDRLRLASRTRLPASAGGRALRTFRFQQTAGGLRVVWSQIDVTVVRGEVRSIGATVVPVSGRPPARGRRVSGRRALAIARRAVPGAEAALRPLPAAYAGRPTSERAAEARRPRSVWVVEVHPRPAPGDDAPTALCIVVDAHSGKVIARWPGMADRPDRGSSARGQRADGVAPAASAAQLGTVVDPRDRKSRPLLIYDGTGKDPTGPITLDFYTSFDTTGPTRQNSSWPFYLNSTFGPAARRSADMDAVAANAANTARSICVGRGWCGRTGASVIGTAIVPWIVIGNTTGRSKASRLTLNVWLAHDSIARGNGDPNSAFNDILAHEFGHVMDWVYAGDRFSSQGFTVEGREVEEALADMFAYDYDRDDSLIGEETGPRRQDLADPGSVTFPGASRPYPQHMLQYDRTPPLDANGDADPHFNASILSHAYYRFVQAEGHARAGRVLHNVPSALSPFPTFAQVANAFILRAGQIYGANARASAVAAFTAVGLQPRLLS
jgi:Zn-dependent metalloprotease